MTKPIIDSTELLSIICRIECLVNWHADTEAEEEDLSPEDMHAHCNGLVLRACNEARLLLHNAQVKYQEGSANEL
jgi:hypothetical protein